ncbi:MAG: 4-hydroxy-tetrahydrodipicolinate synthase [Bacteroidetes bacterium]|nr:4-hydroxy-tetrahydrodipicolinate synthase [Bacteroidota bacterium]
MILPKLRGVGTALITPFDAIGQVDLPAVRRLAARQIENGVDMLVPCGTTGEAVTLEETEFRQILETVVEVADGRVPVIAGAGSNSTAKTIASAKLAAECGVDAVLIVGPFYNKPTQEGYFQHFEAVAAAVDCGVVIYNVPGRTGGNISAETQLRIAEFDNVIATKEASANFSQIYDIVRGKPENFAVLSGDDDLALAQIAIGMDGIISVASNEIPEEFSRMVHHAMDGEFAEAQEIHYRIVDLLRGNFMESSPIPVKTAMAMMGLIEERFRLPLVPIGKANRGKLEDILRSLDLLRS